MDSTTLLHREPAAYSTPELNDAIITLAAHLNAAEHRLIELLGEWDARGQQGNEGCTLVQWLGHQCGIDAGAAREKLRVARALRSLPMVSQRFAAGEVSYSKVRAITRVGTPENEGLLLGYAAAATARQLETIVSGYRRMETLADPDLVLRQQRSRGLTWRWDDDGMLVIQGRFPPEDGALILRALEAVQERLFREGSTAPEAEQPDSPVAARRADALVHLLDAATTTEAGLNGAERHLVILHVPADAPAELEDGPVIPAAIARRIACDTSVVVQTEDADGNPLSVGRRTRSVPPWLRRALKQRDGTCRYPGCDHTGRLDAHHMVHWADGGETSVDNLLLLCPQHHRHVHHHDISIHSNDGTDARRITFRDALGQVIPDAPPVRPGSASALLDLNADLNIDATTCRGGWDGDTPDYGTAVECLQRLNPERFRGIAWERKPPD